MGKADCHMHMVLDGVDWRAAIARHSHGPDDGFIHAALEKYRDAYAINNDLIGWINVPWHRDRLSGGPVQAH